MTDRILITGAGGFLGSHICQYFGERQYSILPMGRFSGNKKKKLHDFGIRNICETTLPSEVLLEVLSEFKPNLIIHCAGSSSVPASVENPYDDFKKNADTLAFILESIRKESPESSFVLLSSAAVYGNPMILPIKETTSCKPISPYGYHKQICEILADEYSSLFGIQMAVLRIFSAYGNGLQKQVIFDLCNKFASDDPVIEVYGTGNETRDFIHAFDVAQAIECIYNSHGKGIFNVSSGVQTSIHQIIGLIKEMSDSDKHVRYSGKIRMGDPLHWCADIDKISALGFRQKVSLHEGIKNYCRWFISERNRN